MHSAMETLPLSRLVRHSSYALLAFSIGILIWYLIPRLFGLDSDLTRNYNEGWMATYGQSVLSDLPVYPSADMLAVNYYPPLWYLVLAAAHACGFDANVAGRVVELLAFAGCGVFVYLIARALAVRQSFALVAAAVFLSAAAAWAPSYIGANDPHLFGQCIMLWGAWVAMRSTRASSLILSALICCAACFVKHSLVAVPLSLGLFYLLTDRRSLWIYALALTAFAAIGLAICSAIWGVDFWHGILSPRTYERWRLRWHVEQFAYFYTSFILAGLVALPWCRKNLKLSWPLIYLGMSLAVATLFQIAGGIAGNHFYDSLVALSLILGLALSRHLDSGEKSAYVMLGTAILLLTGTLINTWQKPLQRFETRAERYQAEHDVIRTLRGIEGRVACEDAILCIEAGKVSEMDFFNTGERLATKHLTKEQLLAALQARNVVAVQFAGELHSSHMLPPKDAEALVSMYSTDLLSNRYFVVRGR